AIAQFGQHRRARKKRFPRLRIEPALDDLIGLGPHRFGKNIRIEQDHLKSGGSLTSPGILNTRSSPRYSSGTRLNRTFPILRWSGGSASAFFSSMRASSDRLR